MRGQCAATLYVQGAGGARNKNNSFSAGKRCPGTPEKDSKWCWQHKHTLAVGLATEEELLTGTRRRESAA